VDLSILLRNIEILKRFVEIKTCDKALNSEILKAGGRDVSSRDSERANI